MMTPERWREVERVFNQAVAAPPGERDALLDRICGDDRELRAQVEKLLASDRDAAVFLDTPALTIADADLTGRTLGPFRVVERIGEGGMGVVYRAVREDDVARYEVAIKVIRRGMDTHHVLHRFINERTTLANLNHPAIARLIDGGTVPDGRPYLVMEYVRGRPIDVFCDEECLTVRERADLFRRVCLAVHFAHQNLVVHRDLKPSNILVTAAGDPKLLDFGIAKMLDSAEDERTVTAARFMTPDYASPEQVRGDAITTATDVYSLGVILYRLLAGARPYALTGSDPIEVSRTIATVNPDRPSTAVGRRPSTDSSDGSTTATVEVAHRRRTSPERLRRELRGDLDNIVLKALRKEPARRYASAEQFAEDLRRQAEGLPVIARPDTFTYRFHKFVRRNPLAVGMAAAIVLSLTGGIVSTAWMAMIAAEERDVAAAEAEHAAIEAESAGQIASFFIDTLLSAAPYESQEQLDTITHQLAAEASRIRRAFEGERHLQANLLNALGHAYLNLGEFSAAQDLFREAAALREAEFGEQSIEMALSYNSLGEMRFAQGDYTEAERLFRRSLELHERFDDTVHTDVGTAANNLAVALRALGRIDNAERLHRKALEVRRRVHGDRSIPVAESLNNLGLIHLGRGQFDSAERLVSAALRIRRDMLGPHHPDTAQSLNNLAVTVHRAGDLERAEKLYREAIDTYRDLGGLGKEGLSRTLPNLADILLRQSHPEQAEELLREALDIQQERLGRDHPVLATTVSKLAEVQDGLGNDAVAQ